MAQQKKAGKPQRGLPERVKKRMAATKVKKPGVAKKPVASAKPKSVKAKKPSGGSAASSKVSAGRKGFAQRNMKSRMEAVKKASGKGGSSAKKAPKRLRSSDYVKWDSRTGRFGGYKKALPKGYTYIPGSRYLNRTQDLRLAKNYSSKEQRDFVHSNRDAVNKALETAARNGAFKGLGLNGAAPLEGNTNKTTGAADFDFAKGGKEMLEKLQEYFHGHPSGMRLTRMTRPGVGPVMGRRRHGWSFVFGQDGHVK